MKDQKNDLPLITNFCEKLTIDYINKYKREDRQKEGQFFTPKEISEFMASLFELKKSQFSLLDPGAGTGMLTAAFCDKILNLKNKVNIKIDLYEKDINLLPLLKETVNFCAKLLHKNGNKAEINIINDDFILLNSNCLKKQPEIFQINNKYDYIITNPPYCKINKNSEYSSILKKFIFGQPNIYSLFLALSIEMLHEDGEIVFITPRSFCSGLYFKIFREWFLTEINIKHIHLFELRRNIFEIDDILQETVIFKAKKDKNNNKLNISISRNKNLENKRSFEVNIKDVVFKKNNEVIIRIPSSEEDLKIINLVDEWPNTLEKLNLKISTGPVVPYRVKNYLVKDIINDDKIVPLIWMHNLENWFVRWPKDNKKKEYMIELNKKTLPLLTLKNTYVFVKRFSSKEQKRRVSATVMLDSDFNYKYIGIENHINYIYKTTSKFSINEAFGIAAILNTELIDKYFRWLNGNTQVNATELRILPLPSKEKIEEIGNIAFVSRNKLDEMNLEKIIHKILNINF
ncbi:MAG: Eco57I restriction-modification methylase domain-containing protein [Candidatus Humimicrobiaceae bacterium]